MRCGLHQAAEACTHTVDEDAGDEGAGASEAVGGDAEEYAANGCADERCGHDEAGFGGGEVKVNSDAGDDEGIEHDVHAVEHPSERSGEQGVALHGACLVQPAEEAVGWGRDRAHGFDVRFIIAA